jgi:CBS domain-containing protein
VSVISVTTEQPVSLVIDLLAERRIGAVPVVDQGRVVGIFSERDVIYGLRGRGAGLLDLPVGEVMTKPPISVAPGQSVLAALTLMTQRRIRHLPVIDNARLIGFISIGDLVKYRIERIEAEAEAMRGYIAGGG